MRIRASRCSFVVAVVGCVVALAPSALAAPVLYDLNAHPSGWGKVLCGTGDGLSFANGLMTSTANACSYEVLTWPNGEWHAIVDSARGWEITARLRVDTGPAGCQTENIWAKTHDQLLMFGFGTGEVCLAYPDVVSVPFDTTSGFHTYRFFFKGHTLTISIDGVVQITTTAVGGDGSAILTFGTVNNSATTDQVITWDSFEYDVAIGLAPCTIVGTAIDDTITGTSGDDNVCAGWGNDTVYGAGGNDSLPGGGGTDKLYGRAGSDRIFGGPGNDALFGGAGADELNGGPGTADTCDGGYDSAVDGATACETLRRIP